MNLLDIKNLSVKVGEKIVLNSLNMSIGEGETHVVLGPNGSGKSSLANMIIGNPALIASNGTISYKGKNLLSLSVDERARDGIFLAFQQPVAIPGVSVRTFLHAAYNSKSDVKAGISEFNDKLQSVAQKLSMSLEILERNLNEGFSGGEKKKLEMLQLIILAPDLAILDEIDSGLDVDALKLIAAILMELRRDNPKISIIVITHQQKLLSMLSIDKVNIMKNGSIIKTGGKELIDEIEKYGFNSNELK